MSESPVPNDTVLPEDEADDGHTPQGDVMRLILTALSQADARYEAVSLEDIVHEDETHCIAGISADGVSYSITVNQTE